MAGETPQSSADQPTPPSGGPAETGPSLPAAPAPAPAGEGAQSAAAAPETKTAVAGRTEFSTRLDSFQGPLDLLLFLVKENEVGIADIPIARILDQYLAFLDQAAQLDLQVAGEFLVMAATLMEIKSRELLPAQEGVEDEEVIEDPRAELIRQLLRYRQLKDQARFLEEAGARWAARFPRGGRDELPPELLAAVREEVPILPARVDLFELLMLHERLRRAVQAAPSVVRYEGETLEEKVARIEKILQEHPFIRFVELILDPRSREDIALTFVALLELLRRRVIHTLSRAEFGDLDVMRQTDAEAEQRAREAGEEAERYLDTVTRERQEREARLQAEAEARGIPVDRLPWRVRREVTAKPKFEGLALSEDVEALDAEEAELSRRVEALLAAADEICKRFEESRKNETAAEGQEPSAGPEGVPPADGAGRN